MPYSTPRNTLITFVVILSIYFPSSLFAEESKPLSLKDCYFFALKQSETIAIQQQLIREAEGRFLQYIGNIFPQVSFESSDKWQNGPGNTSFTLREIPERKFVFSQPIFSGFKEIAAIKASKIEEKQRQHEKRRAEQLLFIDVSDAFYFYITYQENTATLQEIRNALAERVTELKKREELGRSRQSEVAGAEAQLSRIEAELDLITSDWEVARQLLEFLTGQPIQALDDSLDTAGELTPMEEYFEKSENRPDILAAKQAVAAAEKQMTVARAGYWPTVKADGNYYTKRVGNSANVDWDATLTVTMPISQGVSTAGAVKQADAQRQQAQLQLSQTERNAVLEIKNAYTRLQAARRRTQFLQRALDAAEKNYQLQLSDYALNLVNNLVVLQALEDLQEARRDFIIAKYDMKRAFSNFKVTIAETPYDAS